MAGNIFINYRRSDDPGSVHAIYLSLEKKFGSSAIFKDVEGDIKAGYDYDKVLKEKLNDCDVMLVIIGPDWLSEENRERLHDPEDWVRLEIEHGLNTGKRVIPLIIGKTSAMPDAMELPAELSPLAYKQNILIDHMKFSADIEHLIEQITEAFKETEKDKKLRLKQEKAAAAEAARQALEKERKERKQYFSLFLSKLSPFQRTYFVINALCIILAVLNLFKGIGGFSWSNIFANILVTYQALFHVPIDWLTITIVDFLLGWANVRIPSGIKDICILFSLLFLAERIAIKEDQIRYKDTLAYRKEMGWGIYLGMVIVWLVYVIGSVIVIAITEFLVQDLNLSRFYSALVGITLIIPIFVLTPIFALRWSNSRGKKQSPILYEKASEFSAARIWYLLYIVAFVVLLLGLNFTFLKLGL